jgi:hypothetical protein
MRTPHRVPAARQPGGPPTVETMTVRSTIASAAAVATFATASTAVAAESGWVLVKRGPTVAAGETAYVGSLVRRPTTIGVRVVVQRRSSIRLAVTISCRRGLTTRVSRTNVTVAAPGTKALVLPLAAADNCAASVTGSNPKGTLRLDLVRRS